MVLDTGYANAVGDLANISGGYHDKVTAIVQQAAEQQAKQRALQAAAQAQQQADRMQQAQTAALQAEQQKYNTLLTKVTAQQAAQQGQGGYGGMAQPAHVPGNVHQWVLQALGIMHLPSSYANGIENMIQHESGGNPNSINRWDSNAKAGHPSQGLMQTIPGTFSAYALPGYNRNILDPISNIIAGTRYALSRYGSGMVLAGGRRDAQGNYIGY